MIKRNIFKNFSIYFFLSILSIFLAITSSCSNFMDGAEVLESLEKIVEEVSAPVVTVTVGVDNPEYGTTVPSDPRELKLNKEYEIQFKPTSKFQFISWKVTCSDSSVELDKTVKIKDAKALVTKVTVLQELADGVTLSISPVVVQKLGISNYQPADDGKENPKDASIVIKFDNELSETNDLSTIQILSQGESVTEYFNTPSISGNILTITAKKDNLIDVENDKTRNITVVVPETFFYKVGDTLVQMGSEIRWTYKINSTTDSKTEVTCSALSEQGIISPSELKKYSIGESFELKFTPKENIRFNKWIVKDGEGNDISEKSILHFDDISLTSTKVTVLSEMKGITIRPETDLLLAVIGISPEFSSVGAPWDSDIVIKFNKPIDKDSFIFIEKDEWGNPFKFSYFYSIENLQNGTQYQGSIDGPGAYYKTPVFSEDCKVVTIPSMRSDNNSLSGKEISIKLFGSIKDTEGIELKENYNGDYVYETRFSSERLKTKVNLTELTVSYPEFMEFDDNTYRYSLKQGAKPFKVYKRSVSEDIGSKSQNMLALYNNENPLAFLGDNLYMTTDGEELDSSHWDYCNTLACPQFYFSGDFDTRLLLNIYIYSEKAQSEIPSLYDFSFKPFAEYASKGENVREICIDNQYPGMSGEFLPQNISTSLFHGDGVYKLIFAVRDELNTLSDTYYECFVVYKQNFEDVIPDLEFVYDGTKLSYKKFDHILTQVNLGIEDDDIRAIKSNYPISVEIQNRFDFDYFVITNSIEERSWRLTLLLPNSINNIITHKAGEKTEFIGDSSLIFNHLYSYYPNSELKYTTSVSENAEFYDKITIPNSELTNGKKINIYPVFVYSKNNKKSYIYGDSKEFTYTTFEDLEKPILSEINCTQANAMSEKCNISFRITNYNSDFNYCAFWNEEDSEETSYSEVTVISVSGFANFKIPSDLKGSFFVCAYKDSSSVDSDSFNFDTTDEQYDTIPPVINSNLDDSTLKRDVLAQLMIPVEDNKSLFYSSSSVSDFEYSWFTGSDCNPEELFNGEITRIEEGDDKKGFLHIPRVYMPDIIASSNTSKLYVNFSDKNLNFANQVIEHTISSSARMNGLSFENSTLKIFSLLYEIPNLKLKYSEVNSVVRLNPGTTNELNPNSGRVMVEKEGELLLPSLEYPNIYGEISLYDLMSNVPAPIPRLICVNIDVPGMTSNPLFIFTETTDCSIKHLYSDSNGTTLFLEGGTALVLIYAMPTSEVPEFVPAYDWSVPDEYYENECKNAILDRGAIVYSKMYDASTSIIVDKSTGVPNGWSYVVKVVFSDNTTQVTNHYSR